MQFPKPSRTSHTISESRSMKAMPEPTNRRPQGNKPAPLVSRCASCGRRK